MEGGGWRVEGGGWGVEGGGWRVEGGGLGVEGGGWGVDTRTLEKWQVSVDLCLSTSVSAWSDSPDRACGILALYRTHLKRCVHMNG